jgi:hypothetical protein
VISVIVSDSSTPEAGTLVNFSVSTVSVLLTGPSSTSTLLAVSHKVKVSAATEAISTFLLLLDVLVMAAFCRAVQPSVIKLPDDLVIVGGLAL